MVARWLHLAGKARGRAFKLSHLAIGIGVNLVWRSAGRGSGTGRQSRVRAGRTGMRLTQDEMLDHLAAAFALEAQLVTYGFGPIRTAWLNRAARLGQTITARTTTETITGRFDSLAEDGALVLQTEGGRWMISASDIFF